MLVHASKLFVYMPAIRRPLLFLLLFVICFIVSPVSVVAQTDEAVSGNSRPNIEQLDVRVERVIEEKNIEVMGRTQLYQKLDVRITRGQQKGQQLTIENGDLPIINLQRYYPGDRIKIAKSTNSDDGTVFYYVTDYSRRHALMQLFIVFIAVVIAVARWRGIVSLLGMAVSLGIIVWILLPQILSGKDPVMVTVLCTTLIIPITYTLSHGLNRKTIAAMIGTVIAMVCTGILTNLFISMAKLYGFASEEAGFLQVYLDGTLDIRGLLYAGILIGALGVMDDITVSQAAIVEQLRQAAPKTPALSLYRRAMSVGHDHIASLVNTLVLVYTGASLPLLLLFVHTGQPFADVFDLEIIAEEVVRTLVGSIGLIIAVPITTAIACWIVVSKKPASGDHKPAHTH